MNNGGFSGGVNNSGFNVGANNGQITTNSDYTANTESLAGKPSSYFQNNDLAHLREEFSDFDNFPLPLKEVLLDIQYNTGNLNQQNWPNLYRAIRNRDVNGIVSNVHRRDVAQRRNNWTRDTARSIRF